MECNDTIVGHALGQGVLDHFEECIGFLHSVDDHFTGEVPMAGMLRVGLTHVKAFDIGGITA